MFFKWAAKIGNEIGLAKMGWRIRLQVSLKFDSFGCMDERIIEILSEEIRETRNLTLAVRDEVRIMKEDLKETKRKADAAWELVVMTKDQFSKPFWKRWFGL